MNKKQWKKFVKLFQEVSIFGIPYDFIHAVTIVYHVCFLASNLQIKKIYWSLMSVNELSRTILNSHIHLSFSIFFSNSSFLQI